MTAPAEPEVIEGHATVVTHGEAEPQRGLTVVGEIRGHLVSGLGALAAMTDEQFETNLSMLAKAKERAQRMQKALLTEGTDYGTVPGISRPFLHKPGAELFEKAYGLATSYQAERLVGDGVKTPELEYIVHAKVHLGDTDGPIIGEGLGSCNTHESKYRYRLAERVCPVCGVPAVIKGKAEYGGGWLCFKKKDGCGAKWPDGAPEIEQQIVGRIDNDNPYDLANTILKMARKRAGVDGILTATGTSGLFTQDDDSPAVRPGNDPLDTSAETDRPVAAPRGASRATLPTIPKGITKPTSVGQVRLSGLITITDKQRTNGEIRQGPDGPHGGFQFDWIEGGKIASVVLEGAVAAAFAERTGGDPSSVNAVPVVITGEMFGDPWKKKDDATGEMKAMPPARRIVASSIEAEGWQIPDPSATAVGLEEDMTAAADGTPAATKGKAEPKQTTVADAAHEASRSAGPGMTLAALNKALDAGRVAHSFAAAEAQDRYQAAGRTPDEILGGLTDQQRLELAEHVGVLAEEE